MKGESADWRKESDISEGSWRRRDEDLHGRRARVEEPRKREHGGEIGSRNRAKVRESERSARDEHHQSRKQLDNGSWRGANNNQDMGSRQRDRDDNLKTRNEKVDDLHNKRRKEGAHINWDHTEKEDITYNHRESSSSRKREKDDSSDQWKRDEHAKAKDDDMHYVRQKEDGSLRKERGERQRDGDERHRLKQSHEEILSRREREETRPVMRSGRPAEDKTWSSHSRGKDEYKGSGREYHPKDVGRHSDQLKRRDRVENESFSQNRGHEDMHARGNQISNDKKRTRYEKSGTSDERVCLCF
ncbi:UNVERIFIED_CONTAM: FIP1[V]-like protein [Sesamum radiatum]|uniref:FIP1[V]-like protein n=1 Tax=Sesamum radiatum TaxID=300843 RepID=A0AAW2NPV2_SESRA